MLKKYAKYSIVVLIQLTLLAIIILLITPVMLHHMSSIKQGHEFFTRFHGLFFIGHSLFYFALYLLWPHIIRFMTHRQQPSQEQINIALQARYYLIDVFLLFELLNLLR